MSRVQRPRRRFPPIVVVTLRLSRHCQEEPMTRHPGDSSFSGRHCPASDGRRTTATASLQLGRGGAPVRKSSSPPDSATRQVRLLERCGRPHHGAQTEHPECCWVNPSEVVTKIKASDLIWSITKAIDEGGEGGKRWQTLPLPHTTHPCYHALTRTYYLRYFFTQFLSAAPPPILPTLLQHL